MQTSLTKLLAKLLRETANKLETGNTHLSETEMLEIANMLCHQEMSKAMACKYMNLKRSRFDDLVRDGTLPKGKKRVGFNELVWYRDELDLYKTTFKKKNYGNKKIK